MPNLSAYIRNIGLSGVYPDPEAGEIGMTYRQWLIGQALASGASAKSAIAHADEVIKLLAEEAASE